MTVATHSDFGRTLSFNGQGTDHGWAGNHFVLGGSVNGGQVLNDFIETFEFGNIMDAGRGRPIPKYPWESMMAPIAEWMGVTGPETVFPNLVNFDQSTRIIAKSALFTQ